MISGSGRETATGRHTEISFLNGCRKGLNCGELMDHCGGVGTMQEPKGETEADEDRE